MPESLQNSESRILGYYKDGQKLDPASAIRNVFGPTVLPGREYHATIEVKNEHPYGYAVDLSTPVIRAFNPLTKVYDLEEPDLKLDIPSFLHYGTSGEMKLAFTPANDRITPLDVTWEFEIGVG